MIAAMVARDSHLTCSFWSLVKRSTTQVGFFATKADNPLSAFAPMGRKPDLDRWMFHFNRMQKFVRENPKAVEFPFSYPEDETLNSWFRRQRVWVQRAHNEEDLSDERIGLIESLGYPIVPRDVFWELRYKQMNQFVAQHGVFPYDADPAELSDVEERRLLYWCFNQRKAYSKLKAGKPSSLNTERIQLLEHAGFCWNAKDAGWEVRFKELEKYQRSTGNTLVPGTCEENPSLAVWVSEQRYHYKRLKAGKPSSMTEERIGRLEGLGFVWSVWDARWHERLGQLREHVTLNGVGSTPSYKTNRSLHSWVRKQEVQYEKAMAGEKSNMTLQRWAELRKLGFLGPWCK